MVVDTRNTRRRRKRTKLSGNEEFDETDTDMSEKSDRVHKKPGSPGSDDSATSSDSDSDPDYKPEDDSDLSTDSDSDGSEYIDSDICEDDIDLIREEFIRAKTRAVIRKAIAAEMADGDSSGSDDSDDSESDDDSEDGNPMAGLNVPRGSIVIITGMGKMSNNCDHDDDEDDEDEVKDKAQDEKTKSKEPPKPKIVYSKAEKAYLAGLSKEEKDGFIETETKVKTGQISLQSQIPVRFRILKSNASDVQKQVLMQKYEQLSRMEPSMGEYHKLHYWMDSATKLPLGKYLPMKLQMQDGAPKVREFLTSTRGQLDEAVYGHDDAKSQILRILAQWIANPGSKGNVIGIHGGMGTGKTSLVKEGISKALALPFAFIPLGGASDGSFLDGHSYTYEGATFGKIAEMLMKANCMNPVIFFDELDKISDTKKGEEVMSLLMHMTDASQNERYCDKYFPDIEMDLSKTLIVFSYNHEEKVNPILRDRMITIRVNGYNTKEKLVIASDYMLPKIMDQFGLNRSDIVLSSDVIRYIVEKVPDEEGVRNLRRGMECVVSWVNMLRFTEDMVFPFNIDKEFVDKYVNAVSSSDKMSDQVRMSMYT